MVEVEVGARPCLTLCRWALALWKPCGKLCFPLAGRGEVPVLEVGVGVDVKAGVVVATLFVVAAATGCGRTGAGDVEPSGEVPTAQPQPEAPAEPVDLVIAITGDALVAAISNPPDQLVDFDGPATCHWTVTGGERSFSVRMAYESAQDAYDMVGFCPLNFPDAADGRGQWPLTNPLAVEVIVTTRGGSLRGQSILNAPRAMVSIAAVREHLTVNGWTLAGSDGTIELREGALSRPMTATSPRGELMVDVSEGPAVEAGASTCDIQGDPLNATCVVRRGGFAARIHGDDPGLMRELFWALEQAMNE